METRESKRIYITHGAEYRAVEECIYEKNLLFGDVYAQARDCLEEIIIISEQMQETEQVSISDFCAPYEEPAPSGKRKPENVVRRRSSNLIAFCAERGGGKTSAMISFVRALEHLKKPANKREQKENFWKGKKASNYHYELVPSIDPTSMEIDDSILKMVLVHMYSNFQERVKSERVAGGYNNKKEAEGEELIKQFLECFHFANRLNYKTKQPVPVDLEDELEFMEDKECGDTFRVQLYTLFEGYLQYMAPKEKSMLVISIDDADVNTARVYDLLEDVRKYLQMPNVVVMMAANMTQLESTVEQHFLRQYETSLKYNDSMVSVERCHSIAEFYLKKIISSTRQLNLPSLSEELQTSEGNVEIIYRDKSEPGKNLLAVPKTEEVSEEKDHMYGGIYQRQLLGLLHRKTGLIFIPPKGYLHDFLPNGMRELTHFLAFLCDMPDVEATYDTIVDQVMHPEESRKRALIAWQKNLKQLQHYLVNIWSATNLRTASKMLLRELINQPEDNKHEQLLRILPDYYGAERVAQNFLRRIASDKESVYSENFVTKGVRVGAYRDTSWKSGVDTRTDATYMDVMAAIRVLTNSQGGNRQYKLAYAVRLYYTIYLHTILLKDCCVEKAYNSNPIKKIDNECCVTDFLRDGLFKYTPHGDTSLNSAFWHLPIDANTLFSKLFDAEIVKLQEDRDERKKRESAPKKVEELKRMVYQSNQSFVSNCFRVWEENERYAKSELVKWNEITDTTTLVFHPFYPLFAEMDALTSRQIGSKGVQVEYEYDRNGRERLLLAMMILLNTDAQQYLLHEYKEKTPGTADIVPQDVLLGALVRNSIVKNLFETANRINGTENQPQKTYNPDIWEMEEQPTRYLALLSVLPGLQKIYLKYLVQQIDKVKQKLICAENSDVTISELEKASKTPKGSKERQDLYKRLQQEKVDRLLDEIEQIGLKNLLEDFLNIDKKLLMRQCIRLQGDNYQIIYNDLVDNNALFGDKEKGYNYLGCTICGICKLLDDYRIVLDEESTVMVNSMAMDKQGMSKHREQNVTDSAGTPGQTRAKVKQVAYNTYREIFRALFDEMESRNIHIAQISPESDTTDEQK